MIREYQHLRKPNLGKSPSIGCENFFIKTGKTINNINNNYRNCTCDGRVQVLLGKQKSICNIARSSAEFWHLQRIILVMNWSLNFITLLRKRCGFLTWHLQSKEYRQDNNDKIQLYQYLISNKKIGLSY